MKNEDGIRIVSDSGKGRAFLILHEAGCYEDFGLDLFRVLSQKTRVILCSCPIVTDSNWKDLTAKLALSLETIGLKQASFVGFGAANALIQNLCIQDIRLARTLVIVDASTRPHPTYFQRLVDSIENRLPLGLPLRSKFEGFDAKPFLQRLRCPSMIVSSSAATHYLKLEAARLCTGLPTAWQINLPHELMKRGLDLASEVQLLSDLVLQFQEVPAKFPMKNVKSAVAASI